MADGPAPRELDAMGLVFAAEIERAVTGRLVNARLPKRMRERLVAKGWAVEEERTVGRDRFGAITVRVLSLTLAGNVLYCTSLPDGPEDEVEAAARDAGGE